MKIAVVGGCHAPGMATSLRMMLPEAATTCWHVGFDCSPAEVASALPGFDIIISQVADLSGHRDIAISTLRDRYGERVVFVPTMIFVGLHPDAMYVPHGAGMLPGLVGQMHSALIAAAFTMGIPMREVARLFDDAPLFERLGYFREFATCEARFIEQMEYHGLNIGDAFARWDGPFMHTPLHPRADVLTDIAAKAALKAGLSIGPMCDVPDYLGETAIWPLYPLIADRLDLSGGSLCWQRCLGHTLDLDEVIRAEYEIFASTPGVNLMTRQVKAVLECHRTISVSHRAE